MAHKRNIAQVSLTEKKSSEISDDPVRANPTVSNVVKVGEPRRDGFVIEYAPELDCCLRPVAALQKSGSRFTALMTDILVIEGPPIFRPY